MSTYWYLECTDHTPPLQSDNEVEQHTYGLDAVRELCAHRDEITPESLDALEGYFERNTARFLIQHPKCEIRLVSEYGEIESVDPTSNDVPNLALKLKTPDEPDPAA